MTLQPAQLQETIAFIAADRAEMVKALAIALDIESDDSLQAQLRKLARASDGRPFMVTQIGSLAWLKLEDDRGICPSWTCRRIENRRPCSRTRIQPELNGRAKARGLA